VFVLGIMLATSTISTILFFQLPIPIFKDIDLYKTYQEVSFSMGFCWAVIFSLTMLSMCLYPIIIVHRKINKIIHKEEFKAVDKFKNWVTENRNIFSLSYSLRTILSFFSPVIISVITKFFSKSI